MRIRKLQLKNVRCFKDYLLDFVVDNETLNQIILVGRNGTGKSTILKAIVEVLVKLYAFDDEEFSKIIQKNCFSSKDIYFNEEYMQIKIQFELDEKEKQQVGTREFIEIVYYRNDSVDAFLIPEEEEKESYTECFYNFISIIKKGVALYFDAFRYMSSENPLGPNVQEAINPFYSLLLSNIDNDGKSTRRDLELKQWIINIDYMRLKKTSEQYEILYNHLVKAFDLLLHPLKFDCINEEGEILFYDASNEQLVSIDALSDGFKSIFQIVIATMRMLFENSNADELFFLNTGIIIVDEIDCHIHPRWQKSIMPSMRELFPNCQFVVTTHSPYIIESVQDSEIKRIGEKSIV